MKVPHLIVLLTDFRTRDAYVGIMKGVVTKICPSADLIDLSHEIPPGDCFRAAFTLWQAAPYFPEGTVYLCVVDPGVGTSRRPIVVKTPAGLFVGPDNGVFTFVIRQPYEVRMVQSPGMMLTPVSRTFHGRDIFAPAAARLACGFPFSEVGPEVRDPIRLPLPKLEATGPGEIAGEVLFADHFGNMTTSLGRFEREGGMIRFQPWIAAGGHESFEVRHVEVSIPGGQILPWVETFGELEIGECGALIGSTGLLEIVANRKSAQKILNLKRGDPVKLRFAGDQ